MPLTLVGVSLESSLQHVEKDNVLSDNELIRRICVGEVSFFERVMRRYNARVFRTVRAILGDEHGAEDVMQQVYLEAYKRLQEFEAMPARAGMSEAAADQPGGFATWLLRIAVRESRERLGSLGGRRPTSSSLVSSSLVSSSSMSSGLGEWSLRAGVSLREWEGVETEMSNLSATGAEAKSLNGVQLDEEACREGELSPAAACVDLEHRNAAGDGTTGDSVAGDSVAGNSDEQGSARRDSGFVRSGLAKNNAVVSSVTAAGERHLLATVEAAIDELPEALRTVLVLCQVEHLSIAETAATLELSTEAVNARLHQARAMLYDNLAERAEAIAPSVYAFHLTRCDRIVAATMKQINGR